jgi:hypothetical protein
MIQMLVSFFVVPALLLLAFGFMFLGAVFSEKTLAIAAVLANSVVVTVRQLYTVFA